jgi:glycosyltransferase involved in cell wall biosynthesis
VPGVLAAADLVVVPSTWYENAPLIILEARAMGTPLLVSDAGGMGELVDEEAGLRFRLGDAGDLAERLRELLADPSRLGRLGGGAPVPSLEETVSAVERIYGEVLGA